MSGLASAAFRTSAYVAGAATGLMVALPLVAASVGAVAASRAVPPVVAIDSIGPDMPIFQASQVNRTAKGPRLDGDPRRAFGIRAPAPMADQADGTGTVPAILPVAAPVTAPAAPKAPPKAAPSPTRAVETPRGCLSAIGAPQSNLATEELTICVADASVLRNLN